MPRQLLCIFILAMAGLSVSFADTPDWRINPLPKAMSEAEKRQIGDLACGKDGFETTDTGLRCKVCPEYTGDAGSDAGLEVGPLYRGRFTSAKSKGEWLLDTMGCEAHFEAFGGVLLLAPSKRKTFYGPLPLALALGRELSAKPSTPLELVYYVPGYRLNDCLPFGGEDTRALLVCNESDMAQGEVIGHVSAMEVSRRGITRWRLIRWYDNSGSDMSEVLSVTPSAMRRVEPDPGQAGLQLRLKIIQAGRDAYDKAPEAEGRTVNLMFQRHGQRLIAAQKTLPLLAEIGELTRKMLE